MPRSSVNDLRPTLYSSGLVTSAAGPRHDQSPLEESYRMVSTLTAGIDLHLTLGAGKRPVVPGDSRCYQLLQSSGRKHAA